MPVPLENITSTLTNITTNLTTSTPPINTTTTPTPPLAPQAAGGGPDFFTLFLVFALGFMVAMVLTRARSSAIPRLVGDLDRALKEGQAVGIIHDRSVNTLHIVPLKRQKRTWVSTDPDYFTVILETDTMRPTIEGKPVIMAVNHGGLHSMEVDSADMGTLGIARMALGEIEEWDEEYSKENYKKLLAKLLSKLSDEVVGEIPVATNTKLSFTLHMPPVIDSVIRNTVKLMDNVMLHAVDVAQIADQFALKLKELEIEKTRTWTWTIVMIIIAIAAAIMLLSGTGLDLGGVITGLMP